MTKYPENNLEGKRFTYLTILDYSPSLWQSQGRDWKQSVTSTARGREKWKHVCLLACAQLQFSTLTQFNLLCLGNGTAHSGLGFLLTQSRQSHTDMLPGQPDLDKSETLFPGESRHYRNDSSSIQDTVWQTFVNLSFQPLCHTENVSSSVLWHAGSQPCPLDILCQADCLFQGVNLPQGRWHNSSEAIVPSIILLSNTSALHISSFPENAFLKTYSKGSRVFCNSQATRSNSPLCTQPSVKL